MISNSSAGDFEDVDMAHMSRKLRSIVSGSIQIALDGWESWGF